MEASAEEYAAFQERVKRTIYIDNLSPQATEAVLKAAFGQFGNVIKVEFIPNYMNPQLPRAALVEMGTSKAAQDIICQMTTSPFMISGMPRPIRAHAAEVEMFDDRPRKPGRRITLRWLDAGDPGFEAAEKIKNLTRKHAAEREFTLKCQLAEEEKLAKQQSETLKSHYKKYELIDGVLTDGTANRLARRYNIYLPDA